MSSACVQQSVTCATLSAQQYSSTCKLINGPVSQLAPIRHIQSPTLRLSRAFDGDVTHLVDVVGVNDVIEAGVELVEEVDDL